MLVITLAIVATACASADELTDDVSENTTEGLSETTSPSTPATTAASDGGEVEGGNEELVVALASDIDNFDPHAQRLTVFKFGIGQTVFNALVKFDADLSITSDLAVEWSASDDATQFTFELIDGATFHDGTPVTAESVVANIERLRVSESSEASRVDAVESMEVISETELVISLAEPRANFLEALTGVAIMAPSSFEDATRQPVGSGPYVFVEWLPNDKIVLERNPAYFGQQPEFDRLVFRPIPDEQVAFVNLQAGDVDIIVAASEELVTQARSSGFEVVRPSYSTQMLIAEMGGHLDDVRIRRALAHALDRNAVSEAVYNGDAEMLAAPLPPGSWAYTPQADYEFDLDKSRTLLEEAGVGEGLQVQLEIIAARPQFAAFGRVWQEGLAEIGVDMVINPTEVSVWLDTYTSLDYDIILNAFPTVEPHAPFDRRLRHYQSGETNWYDRPDVMELIDAAVATSDQEERQGVYEQLQSHVMEELPFWPMMTRPLASVVADDIDGYVLDPQGWGLFVDVVREGS